MTSWNLAIAGLFLAFPQEPAPAPDAPRPQGERPAGEGPVVRPRPERPMPSVMRPQADDAEREMIELFGRVEATLGEIDRLLQEAASPNAAQPSGAGGEQDGTSSGLAGKLREAQASGVEVQKSIDRILELAAQCRPQSSSSGGSSNSESQEQQSPLDNQGEQSTGRESTPSMPEQSGEKPNGKEQPQPKPGADEPRDQQGGPKDPKDPRDGTTPPHQIPGGEPKPGETGSGSSAGDGRDRWGDLPLHAREVFRNEGGRDMPPLYRDWIDAYYRRLNQKP